MKKKLLGIAIILVVLVGVGIGAVVLYIDTIAKHAVERSATYALGVNTTLESADVGILSGEFSMAGLNVANPENYNTAHFLNMQSGGVQVSLGTLREDSILLPHLTLAGLDMNLESRGGKANYDVILENLKKLESGEEPADAKAENEAGKRFVIEKISITDVKVHLDLFPEGGALTKSTIPIDRIEMTNVGSESDNGVLLSDLSGVLIKAILTAVMNKAGELPDLALAGLEQGLGQLGSVGDLGVQFSGETLTELTGGLGGLGDGLGAEANKALEGAGDDIKKGLDDLGNGLGGLLGGNKNDDDKKTSGDDG